MAERLNKPGNRSIATIDTNKEKWFKQMQQLGHIPSTYNSLDELTNYVLQLQKEGKTPAQISEATGADYRNVISNPMFQPSLSSSGSLRGMDMRAAREDIKPDEQLYLKERFGETFYEDFKRLRELEWGNKNPKKGEDVEALRERVYSALERTPDNPEGGTYSRSPNSPDFESAKTQANRTRDRLLSAFGNGGRASQVDRGHGSAAMETTMEDPDIPGVRITQGGSGVSTEGIVDEIGFLNRGHGSAPRLDPRTMRILNMSRGDLQALYDGYMTHRGLNTNPVRYSGTYLAADEGLRELQQGSQPTAPQLTVPKDPAKVSQDSIEWRDGRLEGAAQQRAADLERQGVNPKNALTQARSEMQKLAYHQSGLLDTTQTTGGPVTITQAASRPSSEVRAENNRLSKAADAKRKKALLAKYGDVVDPNPLPKSTDIQQSNTNLLRIARNTAPLWASIPLSAMVAGQSAQAAIKKPSVNNLGDAGFDGLSALADIASLVPVLAAPAEGLQKALIVPQAAWEGYKATQGKKNKPLPKPPAKLSAAQIRSFQAGGGQAAMLRDGLTREQIIERGSALLLKQKYG